MVSPFLALLNKRANGWWFYDLRVSGSSLFTSLVSRAQMMHNAITMKPRAMVCCHVKRG